MARNDKTEQATPRRRQKARERGQVARSRELSAALVGFVGVLVLLWVSSAQLQRWRLWWRTLPDYAARSDFSSAMPLWTCTGAATLRWVLAPLTMVWLLAVGSNLAQGGFIFSVEALLPKTERLSPATKLGQMFSITGLAPPAKSLIPFSVLLYLGLSIMARDWDQLLRAGYMPVGVIGQFAYQRAFEICWKSTLVLLMWAAIDYLLQRQKLGRDLRMSKQELRDEYKETDGNPTIKARLRRLQRQMRRSRMLKEVEYATVVVTNPSHFAVALQYRPEMAAPVVVAKGADLLAEQIKQVARWHQVPIAENPPLAQALYRTVEIGQAIPAKLYVAVAELLAFIHRAQMRVQKAGARA
jgi:flagellar biosynthesis protein FlhB